MKMAVAVINGQSTQEQFFSVELKHRIVEEYTKITERHIEEDLIFQEVYWGDIVKEEHAVFLEKANYKNDLTYMNMRQLFVDLMGTAIAYTPLSGKSIYNEINQRIKEQLEKLANHRRVDNENTPLIILAHSFGSVAISNYIWDMQQKKKQQGNIDGLSPLEQFDTLAGVITFGSPMGLFSLQHTPFNQPISKVGEKITSPIKERVKWLNFYDKDDVLAFPLKKLNDNYDAEVDEDIEINVGGVATSWNPACHFGYWEDRDFYKPVAKYLSDLAAEHDFGKS